LNELNDLIKPINFSFFVIYRSPYPGLTTTQFVSQLSTLKLIDTLPSDIPQWILKLISSTQEPDPTNRPTFNSILKQLPEAVNETIANDQYINIPQQTQEQYILSPENQLAKKNESTVNNQYDKTPQKPEEPYLLSPVETS